MSRYVLNFIMAFKPSVVMIAFILSIGIVTAMVVSLLSSTAGLITNTI